MSDSENLKKYVAAEIKKSDSVMAEALGQILKEELGIRDARIDAVDGSALLKSASTKLLEGDLDALRVMLDQIGIHKSRIVEAEGLPAIVKAVIR